MITVCCEIYTKHINAPCGPKTEFSNVQPAGTYNTHPVDFKGLNLYSYLGHGKFMQTIAPYVNFEVNSKNELNFEVK
jgi:hypothetical protein